jgi:hypothetical protein
VKQRWHIGACAWIPPATNVAAVFITQKTKVTSGILVAVEVLEVVSMAPNGSPGATLARGCVHCDDTAPPGGVYRATCRLGTAHVWNWT